jgi:hypothetical protein
LAQIFFEVFIDSDVLVVAKEAVGKFRELSNIGIGFRIFPSRRQREVGVVFG